MLAAMATNHGLVTPPIAIREAATRVISPGTGMPMLSTPMTSVTMR